MMEVRLLGKAYVVYTKQLNGQIFSKRNTNQNTIFAHFHKSFSFFHKTVKMVYIQSLEFLQMFEPNYMQCNCLNKTDLSYIFKFLTIAVFHKIDCNISEHRSLRKFGHDVKEHLIKGQRPKSEDQLDSVSIASSNHRDSWYTFIPIKLFFISET